MKLLILVLALIAILTGNPGYIDNSYPGKFKETARLDSARVTMSPWRDPSNCPAFPCHGYYKQGTSPWWEGLNG